MGYTEVQIREAKELVQLLESFDNKHLAIAANVKRVSDASRGPIISSVLVEEYGDGIFSHRVFNPFGNDTVTSKFHNPNSSPQ